MEARRREELLATITARRQQTVYATGAFVLLLAALFFGMVYTPFPSAYPFVTFAGLILEEQLARWPVWYFRVQGRTTHAHRSCSVVSLDLSSASPTSSRNGSARRVCLSRKQLPSRQPIRFNSHQLSLWRFRQALDSIRCLVGYKSRRSILLSGPGRTPSSVSPYPPLAVSQQIRPHNISQRVLI
jgi:hypothetical protein